MIQIKSLLLQKKKIFTGLSMHSKEFNLCIVIIHAYKKIDGIFRKSCAPTHTGTTVQKRIDEVLFSKNV